MEQGSLFNDNQPSTHQLVAQLKTNGDDFEWYPTTNEMLLAIADDIADCSFIGNEHSFLDIGCGDGRVLKFMQDYRFSRFGGQGEAFPFDYYGIEKSETHLKNLVKKYSIIGTDFWETNLTDKQTSIIFCNPPYSEYAQWVENILNNGFTLSFYFVIPERWKNNEAIRNALKRRNLRADVIFEGDFLGGDRAARAKINVVRVANERYFYYPRESYSDARVASDKPKFTYTRKVDSSDDPFNDWFNNLFQFDLSKDEYEDKEQIRAECREVFVKSHSIQELADWYTKDLSKIQQNYESLAKLDSNLIRELGVNLDTLKEGVRNRFSQLKTNYWRNFLEYYEPIRQRLTESKRNELANKLLRQTATLDFTVRNMLLITEIAISRANDYLEEQVKNLYLRLADVDNVKMYKSNQRVFDKYDWRYNREKEPFKLDFRIVTTGVNASSSYFSPKIEQIQNNINDLCIVLRTLGYNVENSIAHLNGWNTPVPFGDRLEFMENNLATGKSEIAFEAKYYKNGNCHLRFRKDLMLALNVAAGRLFGWVTSPEQAADEMGEDVKEVAKYWQKSDALCITNKTQLIGLPNFN